MSTNIDRDLVKKTIGLTVKYGTSIILNGIIKKNVQPKHIGQSVGIYIASLALGAVATQAAIRLIEEDIDAFFNQVENFQKKVLDKLQERAQYN